MEETTSRRKKKRLLSSSSEDALSHPKKVPAFRKESHQTRPSLRLPSAAGEVKSQFMKLSATLVLYRRTNWSPDHETNILQDLCQR